MQKDVVLGKKVIHGKEETGEKQITLFLKKNHIKPLEIYLHNVIDSPSQSNSHKDDFQR